MRRARPFVVERRAIVPRSTPYAPDLIHRTGIKAVARALTEKPLADDVSRILSGRTTFPKFMHGGGL